jgi:2-(1,2-epoxy-1,2-dihydrophenyl)acetyl-CoA isomerase
MQRSKRKPWPSHASWPKGPTLAYGHMKENLLAAMELDPRTAFDIEARNFMRCFQTEDHKEAVAAFKEKRKPAFKGR